MFQTPIMNHPRGNHSRRYSHLELPGTANLLRPRSCSTSMVTVAEAIPDLRSVGWERRPSATPCTTPCFVSPRMAFTTQFSYDSPIQIITCGGGDVLKPVAKWRSRWPLGALLCSRKAILFAALLTICVVPFLLLSGKEDSPPVEEHCDALDPATPCHSHYVISPLQKFLRQESSSWEQSAADPQKAEAPAVQEGEKTEATEQRTNRLSMLTTIQGQYEDSDEEFDNDQDTSGEVNITDYKGRGEEETEGGKLNHFPETTFIRQGELPGAKIEFSEADQGAGEEHSTRVVTESLNHHGEQQIVQKEMETLATLRHGQQEELWQEKRRRHHHRSREGYLQPHPRRPGGGEQWEAGHPYPPSLGVPHQRESGEMDGRHLAWRDHRLHGQRLPRGVNPGRYYMHADL